MGICGWTFHCTALTEAKVWAKEEGVPLDRFVATEKDFIALLRNEACNKFMMSIVSGP